MISSILLSEIIERPISGEWGSEGGSIKVLRTTNFTNERTIDFTDVVERAIPVEKVEKKRLANGDIIIEKSGGSPTQPVGRVVYFDKDGLFLTNNFTAILRPKRDKVFPKYLLYLLFASHKYGYTGSFQNKTTGIINLKLTNYIEQHRVPLPPLPAQQKIAAILDAADAYRQQTKALIHKYDELTQSLFLEMFGDLSGDITSLGSICEINPKKAEIADINLNTLVSFVPMANVSEDGQLSLNEERTIEEVWTGFTYFRENDVVFAKITPCMENGKGAIMKGLKNNIGFGSTEFHVLRAKIGKSTAEFLFHLTHSPHFRKNAELNMTGSAGQKRVPREFLNSYQIVPPPISIQNQFAERVQAIELQKEQAQQSLAKAEELFNSLLQRAFKGELV